ncbi:hypothetical protein D3C76_1743830 [compost metagenome]
MERLGQFSHGFAGQYFRRGQVVGVHAVGIFQPTDIQRVATLTDEVAGKDAKTA